MTIASGILMTCLIFSEFNAYLSPNLTEELFVDTTRGHKLKINLDIYIPVISCDYLSLDAMDSTGEQHLHIEHNIYKRWVQGVNLEIRSRVKNLKIFNTNFLFFLKNDKKIKIWGNY